MLTTLTQAELTFCRMLDGFCIVSNHSPDAHLTGHCGNVLKNTYKSLLDTPE